MWFIDVTQAISHIQEKNKLTSPKLPPPPAHRSFTQFPSPSQSEYINPVQAERIFGKPQFGKLYVNMSRNICLISFVIRQKHRAVYMKRVRFTVQKDMRCS